jgi:DNA-binding CsgD family transcriptional regulator
MPVSNSELSEREQEILLLVATGASNKEIAQQLFISTNTVKVHLRNIFSKIGAASRTEAAMYAVNTGLVAGATQLEEPAMVELGEATHPVGEISDESLHTPVAGRLPSVLSGRLWLWAVAFILVTVVIIVTLWLSGWPGANHASSEINQVTPQAGTNWQLLTPLSQARYGLAVVGYENQVYAIGGMTGQGISNAVDIYDPLSGIWKTGQSKPLAVKDIQAVVIGGKIYAPGGEMGQGQITDRLEIYDPRQDAWTTGAALPVPLSAYALVAFDGRMYLFGGWDGQQALDSVYRYDPEQDIWTVMPSMPTARRYLGAAVSGRRIFLIGGEYDAAALRTNEIFSPDQAGDPQAAWQTGDPLPEAIYGMGVTSVADIIYIVGGENSAARQYSVLAYDQLQGWRSIQAQPGEMATYVGVTNLSTFLYVMGGQVGDLPSDSCYSYQAMYTLSLPLIVK